ncbi:hypothetical protein U2T78_003517 [Providencia stuartii]|uniref:hypothetical protein n=2 Tax=Providencia TaxID=586 RepID=UPI000ACBFDEA|nr:MULTISPECIES: hypothetical protein [Providencia]EMA3642741.1 hypothetical protein [Providencia stuartii]MBN5557109.1 hypothetical protein [Providencia stuartii]MBN5591905.1 hypothetical protein [Providencia stuartii]MBQ0695064.1 hypothetical protein [Providencia stuartii]MBW3101510.1 hypothetical protein [Providencia stuartii]
MSHMEKALQSVIDLHILIENVFTGKDTHALTPLLASFDDAFAMVTIKGERIGLEQVNELFSQNIGTRPSLTITLSDIKPIFELGEYCWIQYQELHETPESRLLRTATVCIKVLGERCFWVYLHETPINKN